MNLKVIKYKHAGVVVEIYYSKERNDYYLSQLQLTKLYGYTASTISKKLTQILKENESLGKNFSSKNVILEKIFSDKKERKTKLYNLEIVLQLGDLLDSKNGANLKEFLNNYIDEEIEKNGNNIIIYNNGKLKIPINFDYKNETIWSTSRQMAQLFETTSRNIYLHIENIINEGELDNSVVKEYFTTQSVSEEFSVTQKDNALNLPIQKTITVKADDGKTYPTIVYNLDMVLAVGYRVRSTAAMKFRNWASQILKEVMFKGYAYDFDKLLENKYSTEELLLIIIKLMQRQNNELVYFDGAELRGFIEVKRFLETAKKEIIIIDNYFGHSFDEVLSRINVAKTIITNPKNIKIESNENYKVIKTDIFHDRFIIVDDSCYNFGKSIDDLGGNFSIGKRTNDEVIIRALKEAKETLIKKEENDIHN